MPHADNDISFDFGDIILEDPAPSAAAPDPFAPADEILARVALDAALDGPTRGRLRTTGTRAMATKVPTPAWRAPIADTAAVVIRFRVARARPHDGSDGAAS